jgi:hypothetical protein
MKTTRLIVTFKKGDDERIRFVEGAFPPKTPLEAVHRALWRRLKGCPTLDVPKHSRPVSARLEAVASKPEPAPSKTGKREK